MFTASNKFQSYTAASVIRRPKSKIEVGGVTYTGETALVSYPKINHAAEKMIGGFPAKTCTFEIYNRSGDISLNGKEITVYRGLEIDGTDEWVPMGLFTAEDKDITNNLTKRSISFKGTDRSRLFDTAFEADIEYPCTVAEFVSCLCERHGVALETEDFPFADRVLLAAPNVDSSTSEREFIARIAELGGCIAQISRTGGLLISSPQATGKTVTKRYYKAVSEEPVFGPITAVTLGHAEYSDDIVYPEDADEGDTNWRIEDNPFVDGVIAEADGTTATTRETLIADIAANIIGRGIIPFAVTDFVDDFVFDLNDAVTVEEKDGGMFETVILNLSTASRIKSNIGADTQSSGSTNYSIAGSVKQGLKKVLLEVDHQNNKIAILAQDFTDLENEVTSSLDIMAGKIQGVVTQDALSTTVTQLNKSWEVKFSNLENPDSLENAATKITADGVEIYNGSIAIYQGSDNSSVKILEIEADDEGNAYLKGNIRANSLELPDGYIGTNMLAVGNIAKTVNNLLTNGDFSSDIDDDQWENNGHFQSAYIANAHYFEMSIPVGAAAVRLLRGSKTTSYPHINCDQKITVTAGEEYTASFYIKRQYSSDRRLARMCVDWHNSSGTYITSNYVSAEYSADTATSWTRFSGTVTAPSNAAYAYVSFYLYLEEDGTFVTTYDGYYVYIAGLMLEKGSVLHTWDNGKVLNNTIITEAGIDIYNGAIRIYDSNEDTIFSVNEDSSGNMYIGGAIQASSLNTDKFYIYNGETKIATFDSGVLDTSYKHLGIMSALETYGTIFGYWKENALGQEVGYITVKIPNQGTDSSQPDMAIAEKLWIGDDSSHATLSYNSNFLTVGLNTNNSNSNSFQFDLENGVLYAPNGCIDYAELAELSANSVEVTSDVSAKTNIAEAESMLDKICSAGIYSYNYISDIQSSSEGSGDIVENGEGVELETAATHYGLVIGDGYNTPEEVISTDGAHINLYSMIALAWKAIQELADKLNTYTAEVTENAD